MTSSLHHILLIISLCLLCNMISAYPNGPPTDACTSLFPSGHAAEAQPGLPPYTITLDTNTYSPGKTIRVTITGVDNTFRGFFLQVRRKDEFRDTTKALGTFVSAPTGTKLLTCHSNPDSGWVHSSAADKTTVEIDWIAPDTAEGGIAFKATIVQGPAAVYWSGVLSNIINYDGPTGMTPTGGAKGTTSQPITLLLAVAMGILTLIFLQQ